LVQRFDLDSTTVIKKIVREVVAVNSDGTIELDETAGWAKEADTGVFAVGDEVVAIGNTNSDGLDSSIYMSAVDSDNPFLRVFDGVNSYADWNLDNKDTLRLQLGNLESVASHGIVPASPGYGLYSDNVYLEGKIVATSGAIGGWTIDSEAIYTESKHMDDDYTTSGITLGSDGSFHAPDFYINSNGEVGIRAVIVKAYKGVSDTIMLSHDAEAHTSSGLETLLKTITLGEYVGNNRTLRIKFDLRTLDSTFWARAQIYRNGDAVGTLRTTFSESYVTYEEDIDDWNANDEIRLYGFVYVAEGSACWVQHLRVCGEIVDIVDEITGANS